MGTMKSPNDEIKPQLLMAAGAAHTQAILLLQKTGYEHLLRVSKLQPSKGSFIADQLLRDHQALLRVSTIYGPDRWSEQSVHSKSAADLMIELKHLAQELKKAK